MKVNNFNLIFAAGTGSDYTWSSWCTSIYSIHLSRPAQAVLQCMLNLSHSIALSTFIFHPHALGVTTQHYFISLVLVMWILAKS